MLIVAPDDFLQCAKRERTRRIQSMVAYVQKNAHMQIKHSTV